MIFLLVTVILLSIFGACGWAIFIAVRILFFNDFRYIKDEDGAALMNRQALKYKFTLLYGVSGIVCAYLVTYVICTSPTLSHIVYAFTGCAGVFNGVRWFLIYRHKKSIPQIP
jgi:uncharacterized membrane protein YuzA (DUF378 family)